MKLYNSLIYKIWPLSYILRHQGFVLIGPICFLRHEKTEKKYIIDTKTDFLMKKMKEVGYLKYYYTFYREFFHYLKQGATRFEAYDNISYNVECEKFMIEDTEKLFVINNLNGENGNVKLDTQPKE